MPNSAVSCETRSHLPHERVVRLADIVSRVHTRGWISTNMQRGTLAPGERYASLKLAVTTSYEERRP